MTPDRSRHPGEPDISVVIPAFNAAEYLPGLLRSIEAQTLLPGEIVVVDSSSDCETEAVLREWRGSIPVVRRRLSRAYPGHARNAGVELAGGEWIAFLDCRTVPDPEWLRKCSDAALKAGAGFVVALRTATADSRFKRVLLAATYGHAATSSLSGSLVRRDLFVGTGGFLPSVRAGEDLEWMKRLALSGATVTMVDVPVLQYQGLPSSLGTTVRKWYEYTNSNARIDVLNSQKVLYMSVFVMLYLLLVYKWNHLFAHWNRESVLFIPHVTKISLTTLFLAYLVFRGLIRPVKKEVSLSFLLPWRWLAVSYVGLCLDLAKAPGLILGALILLRKKMGIAARWKYRS